MGFFGDIASSIGDVNKNMLEETNKNNSIKSVKFEIMVDDLAEWLGKWTRRGIVYGYSTTEKLNPLQIIFDIDKVNVYAKKLIQNIFKEEDTFCVGNRIESIENTGRMGIKELVAEGRGRYNLGFNIIFWSLFIVAVDESAYNEKLSDISDIAYLLGFTEEMMKDWITALRLILEGKDFKNYIYLSKEANKFFGHR